AQQEVQVRGGHGGGQDDSDVIAALAVRRGQERMEATPAGLFVKVAGLTERPRGVGGLVVNVHVERAPPAGVIGAGRVQADTGMCVGALEGTDAWGPSESPVWGVDRCTPPAAVRGRLPPLPGGGVAPPAVGPFAQPLIRPLRQFAGTSPPLTGDLLRADQV